MVLGMKSGQIFRQSLEEQVTRLDAGDRFLLYTDGITETMNSSQEEFGPERLGEVLRAHADERPDRMLDMMMERLRMFRGPLAVSDDLTMLVLAVE
jgi:sigma-B regulation protein RsbU (phosphoserine phosphatase)